MGLKPPDPGTQWKRAVDSFDDALFRDQYPTLTSYLFDRTWEDGSARMPATLTLYADGDALMCVINDRANLRSAFISNRCFTALLDAIEDGLTTGQIEWKQKRDAARQTGYTPF